MNSKLLCCSFFFRFCTEFDDDKTEFMFLNAPLLLLGAISPVIQFAKALFPPFSRERKHSKWRTRVEIFDEVGKYNTDIC